MCNALLLASYYPVEIGGLLANINSKKRDSVKTSKPTRAAKSEKISSSNSEALLALDEASQQLLAAAGLTQELGFVLRMAQLAVFENIQLQLQPLKVNLSQLTVLRLIDSQASLNQQRIGDALRIKKSNLVMLIKNLEEKNLVLRTASALDKRAYVLELTSEGKRVLKKALPLMSKHLDAITELVSPDDQAQLISGLMNIARNLNQNP